MPTSLAFFYFLKRKKAFSFCIMDSKASAAASAFVDEDYAKAAELFTEAISACSDNAQKSELFARRAAW